jgi:hypothetical protein
MSRHVYLKPYDLLHHELCSMHALTRFLFCLHARYIAIATWGTVFTRASFTLKEFRFKDACKPIEEFLQVGLERVENHVVCACARECVYVCAYVR